MERVGGWRIVLEHRLLRSLGEMLETVILGKPGKRLPHLIT